MVKKEIPKEILQATLFGELAYEEFADIESELLKQGSYSIEIIDNKETDTQGFMCQDRKRVYNIIRGTEFTNLHDWLTNLDCRFIRTKYGVLHTGFHIDSKSIRKQVLAYNTKCDAEKITVVGGHSQGGGVGTDLAMALARYYKFDLLAQVATPRNMDDHTAEMFGQLHGHKIYFIQNNNDIVTRVPPRLWGYRHPMNRNLIYFMEDGEYRSELSKWTEFKDRVNGIIQDIGEMGFDQLSDHYPSRYSSLVRAAYINPKG